VSLRWLIGLAVLALAVVVALLEYSIFWLSPSFISQPARWTIAGVVIAGFLFTAGALVAAIRRTELELERRSREVDALYRATLDISGELSLEQILHRVVEQARLLLDAEYGAVSVMEHPNRIVQFITSGMSEQVVERIGEPPKGNGLLGVPLHAGGRLRVGDVAQDPRSTGLPPHHPAVKSLLAVPISCKSPFRGNLYLANKRTSPEFGHDDEKILVRFAAQVAVAIENAHLHQRLSFLAVTEERGRIAREMHDGMAQLLAYVNTKAQAAGEHLKRERVDAAREQLDELALAARDLYVDIREGILSLRTSAVASGSLEESLNAFLLSWQEQAGVHVEAEFEGDLQLEAAVELQLLRILQEALTNIRKHSGARLARLEIHREGSYVVAVVRDDGKGFEVSASRLERHSHYGLAIMRERAQSRGPRFGCGFRWRDGRLKSEQWREHANLDRR